MQQLKKNISSFLTLHNVFFVYIPKKCYVKKASQTEIQNDTPLGVSFLVLSY